MSLQCLCELFYLHASIPSKGCLYQVFLDFHHTRRNPHTSLLETVELHRQVIKDLSTFAMKKGRAYVLSTSGCRLLCGSGAQWCAWLQIAGTVIASVLPVIGILLQAPFESNEV